MDGWQGSNSSLNGEAFLAAQKDGRPGNHLKWALGEQGWISVSARSSTPALLQWGQANCWMDGQGAGLLYPWVCWGALVFSVPFALPQHVALLI